MARFAHKTTDSLTPEAQRLMISGFRAKLTYKSIAYKLAELGVTVPERTIARRAVEFRAAEARRQAAREQMAALVGAMKEGNWSAAEMIQALATDALMQNPDALTGADPLKVQRQNLQAEQLRLKREELEIKRRAVEVDERRIAMLQEREKKAAEAAAALEAKAGRGEQISAEDVQRIREIYGLGAQA